MTNLVSDSLIQGEKERTLFLSITPTQSAAEWTEVTAEQCNYITFVSLTENYSGLTLVMAKRCDENAVKWSSSSTSSMNINKKFLQFLVYDKLSASILMD